MRRFFSPFWPWSFPLRSPRLEAQGAPPQGGAGQPYTIEYYYKGQWGHQEEFLRLFLKNHYPLLKKIQATGRILSRQDRVAGLPHHRGRPLGLSRHHPLQELDRGHHSQPRRRGLHQGAMAGPGDLSERRTAAV